jgi:hypothetical protein
MEYNAQKGKEVVNLKKYNAQELIELIAEGEQEVAKLYHDLASKVNDSKSKAVFEKLAGDEERHEKIYRALLKRLDGNMEVHLTDEDHEFTRSLIDYNLFRNEGMKKRFVKERALILAERIERDTLLMVNQLADFFPHIAEEELKIIKAEEKKHLSTVMQMQQDAQLHNLML